ncbi:MAG: hypothetical protein AAGC55_14330 [Myxococcota bacterium]
MKKLKGINVLATLLIAGTALLAGSVSALAGDMTAPGVEFKAAYGSSQDCLSVLSYGGIQNTCSYRVTVVAWAPVASTGNYGTEVQVYGNNTWCQSMTINGVGNASHLGSQVWTSAGPDAWKVLNTGTRYQWDDMGILFRCGLDAGERIGRATTSW